MDRPNSVFQPHLVRRATRLRDTLDELERILQALNRDRGERYGLPGTQVQGLLRLTQDGPMTVSGLGHRMVLDKSTASRLAKGLLREGLVRKRSPESDDRRVILQVTERGMRMARRILNDSSEQWIDLLSRLDPESKQDLPGALAQLVRELRERRDHRT